MASNNPQVHHGIPPSLLTLHQKANGTELDGEGIQAWLEWEMEAIRWKVPVEISRTELEALVDSSEIAQQEGRQLLYEGDRFELGRSAEQGLPQRTLNLFLTASREHDGAVPPWAGCCYSRGFECVG